MDSTEIETPPAKSRPNEPEYSEGRRRRHRSREAPPRPRPNRLRVAYFSLAALWGCAIGVGAVAAGSRMTERPVVLDASLFLALVPAALLSVLGGAVASGAYGEARNRRR